MDKAVHITSELIQKRTITPQDDGAIKLISNILTEADFNCHEIVEGSVKNLFARWGPKDSKKTLGFSGHVDVVPTGDMLLWDFDPFSGLITDNEILGRGAVDMKSAVAAFTVAATDFVKANKPNGSIVIAITGDEEGDALHGTKAILKWMEKNDELVNHFIVGEPTSKNKLGDTIKIGRRGSLTAYFVSSGIQGHTAYPHLASNPIHSMNELVHSILNDKLDQGSKYFEPSTSSFTTIDVGNITSNVIPATCNATLNIRFNDLHSSTTLINWLENHTKRINALYNSQIRMEVKVSGESFINSNSNFTKMIINEITDQLKLEPSLSTSGGTSDARFIKDFSEVLELGLVGKTMHQVNERVNRNDVVKLTDLYQAIIKRYFSQDL